MTKYEVTVPEVWYQRYEVEANSEEEAIAKVWDEEAEEIGEPEYAYTQDSTQAYAISETELNNN